LPVGKRAIINGQEIKGRTTNHGRKHICTTMGPRLEEKRRKRKD